jgi:ubiquinone/menaquinone biosynthesis C-methylase UbiE
MAQRHGKGWQRICRAAAKDPQRGGLMTIGKPLDAPKPAGETDGRALEPTSMDKAGVHEANADQAAYWNGVAGQRWIDRQETLDLVLTPIQDILLARAAVVPGERIIDIGCGCGTSTIALARQTGRAGHVIGVDISRPMLAQARERAPADLPLEFVLADATVHPFIPGSADLLFSRFGVMFFANPTLSFANMRTALRHEGRLIFASWREPRLNPWMLLPLQEAYRHVPRLPEVGPEDPGPFSFAREERVRHILSQAGYALIGMDAVDLTLDLAVGRGLESAVAGALVIGPVSRALEGQPAEDFAKVRDAIRTALASCQKGDSVPLGASVWIATALSR